MKLIENQISFLALHTNFDICVMADLAADKLDLTDRQVLEEVCIRDGEAAGFGRIGRLPEPMTLRQLAKWTRDRLELDFVTVSGDLEKTVKKIAISTGAGKSGIENCIKNGAEVLITGDVDHHTAVDALEMGLFLIDAGHFGTEKMFADYMESYLREQIPEVEVYKASMRSPFQVI